tara:strand:+ start:1702 stop:1905 length:204 start_codon:yes stop_codon:yes gene_type:complete
MPRRGLIMPKTWNILKLRSRNIFKPGSWGKKNTMFSHHQPLLRLASSKEATLNPVFVLGNMLEGFRE